MEYTTQSTPPMSQSPFFYYSPDPSPETRQHGRFTAHPQQPHGLPMTILPSSQEQFMTFQQPMYQRPPSAGAPMPFHPHAHIYGPQAMLTPAASPRHEQKPNFLCSMSCTVSCPSTPTAVRTSQRRQLFLPRDPSARSPARLRLATFFQHRSLGFSSRSL